MTFRLIKTKQDNDANDEAEDKPTTSHNHLKRSVQSILLKGEVAVSKAKPYES